MIYQQQHQTYLKDVISKENKIQITLWIELKSISLWHWKMTMLPYLKKEQVWIICHTSPINCVHTTILGFCSGKYHPTATHFPSIQHNLNDQITQYIEQNDKK